MRSYWQKVAPNSSAWCPYKEASGRRGPHSRRRRETAGDAAGRGRSDVSTGQGMSGCRHRREVKEARRLLPGPSEGASPPDPLTLDCDLQNHQRIDFCCLKPPARGHCPGQPRETDTLGMSLGAAAPLKTPPTDFSGQNCTPEASYLRLRPVTFQNKDTSVVTGTHH